MNRSERIAACPYRHTSAVGGWFPGENEYLELLICANGRPQLKAVCHGCTDRSSAIPQRFWKEWRLYYPGDVVITQNASWVKDECCVRGCVSRETEYHHFAPWNTFGTEADDWPCLPVCVTHHREWHSRMDGYRWHAARVSVA